MTTLPPIPPDPLFDDVFTVDEAAAYLGMPVPTFEDQIYRFGRLQGVVKGKTLLFSRAQLDTFRDMPRPKRGRPRREG